jgi:hypothetical protein
VSVLARVEAVLGDKCGTRTELTFPEFIDCLIAMNPKLHQIHSQTRR